MSAATIRLQRTHLGILVVGNQRKNSNYQLVNNDVRECRNTQHIIFPINGSTIANFHLQSIDESASPTRCELDSFSPTKFWNTNVCFVYFL